MTLEANENIAQKIVKFSFTNQYSTQLVRTSYIDRLSDIRSNSLDELVINNQYWYNCNDYVNLIYDNYSKYMHLNFRSTEAPKRCKEAIKVYTKQLTEYLKSQGRKQIVKYKVEWTVKHVVKHISRMFYHKHFGLRYSRDENYYKGNQFRVSYTYLLAFIDMLVEDGLIINYTGYTTKTNQITSMFIPSQQFVDKCVGNNAPLKMEDCLRENISNLCRLRERVLDDNGKVNKINIEIPRGDKMKAKGISSMMSSYINHLSEHTISVNGVNIPEIFLYRTFIQDLDHGGRIVWDDFQNLPKSERLTAIIDGEQTVSLDFWCLHLCLAAELEKWTIGDHNPYESSVQFYVDWWEVLQHTDKYELTKYNPARNICKNIVLTCLNAQDKTSAMKAIAQSLYKDSRKINKDNSDVDTEHRRKFVGVSLAGKLEQLVDDIIARNSKVSRYFNSDFGIKAQNYESQIAQICVDTFMSYGKVCLPVHDSITVKVSDIEFGLQVMEDAYETVMGSKRNCRIEIESL